VVSDLFEKNGFAMDQEKSFRDVQVRSSETGIRTIGLVWGLVVVVLLAAGAIVFLIGLAVVLPILGHATWHLYRKVVES
jgi:uncharacterized membrane protein